LKSHQEMQYL